MSIIDTIKGLFGHVQEHAGSVEDLKTKAEDLAGQHGETINNAVDGIQEKIPGNVGDGVIDGAQEKINNLGNKQQ